MQLRYKVVLLAVVPLVLAAALLAFVFRGLAESQVNEIDEFLARDEFDLMAKSELRNLMELARKAIPDLDSAEHDDQVTRQRVLKQLRSLDFGENGYFFVYDMHGTTLMHPWWLPGKNLFNLTDDRGDPVVRHLLEAACSRRAGDGFLRYRWPRPPPSSQQWEDKFGYVVCLPHWGWILGTGLYLGDITALDEMRHQIHASSTAAVSRTMRWIALIAVLAVVVVASLGVALNVSQHRLADAKLRKLTWNVVAAEEQERARVSRYLHDEAMQDLIAVKAVIETALVELRRQPSYMRLAEMLDQGLVELTQAVDQVRSVSHGLRPRLLGDGLPALLAQCGATFSERTGLVVTVDVPAVLQPMSAEAATALFRVTQQALDNINRHARATCVTIRLAARSRWGSSGTSLSVTDDGCGFDVGAVERRPGGGIGLLNMRERIEALGGRLFIRSGSNGTHIEVFLPNEASRKGDAYGNHETDNEEAG
jgi:two-component system NarL family sensor kinase